MVASTEGLYTFELPASRFLRLAPLHFRPNVDDMQF
jgi:hypothetical protein